MLDRDPSAKSVNIIHALLLELDRNHGIARALLEQGAWVQVLYLNAEIEIAQKAIYEHDAIAIIRALKTLKANELPPAPPL